MRRNYFSGTRYVDEVPFFMLWEYNKDATKTFFVIDDAYLTPLCQYVQLPFLQIMDRIKHLGLMLKVLCQLLVCVTYWVHLPDLPSV